MIHWKPAHSAAISAISLSVALLLYYLFATLPILLPGWLATVMSFMVAILLGSTLDHGLRGAPLKKRLTRFVLSVITIVAWLEVGQYILVRLSEAPNRLNFQNEGWWWQMILSELGWLSLVAIVLAGVGMGVARWLERSSTALLVIDQPKQKA